MTNKIHITAVRKLDQSEIDSIKKKFNQSAEVELHIDENLIGGVIIRYKDDYFDGSIAGQLEKLKQKLIS